MNPQISALSCGVAVSVEIAIEAARDGGLRENRGKRNRVSAYFFRLVTWSASGSVFGETLCHRLHNTSRAAPFGVGDDSCYFCPKVAQHGRIQPAVPSLESRFSSTTF
jgi:hypothetical protein